MTDAAPQFNRSIPELYDRYMGPVLFEPYATDLARRITVPPGGRMLEIACGTGIVTRALLAALPPDATLVATDLSDSMLGFARERLADPRLEWRQADATSLPFDDDAFDAVVCQFGAMFFPDKPAAFAEARRVLREGGTFVFSVWGSLGENPLGRIPHESSARYFPPDDARGFYEIPFGFHDTGLIRRLLADAGFEDVRAHRVELMGHAESAAGLAEGLTRGTPLVNAIRDRIPERESDIVAEMQRALTREFGDTALEIPMVAHVIEARR